MKLDKNNFIDGQHDKKTIYRLNINTICDKHNEHETKHTFEKIIIPVISNSYRLSQNDLCSTKTIQNILKIFKTKQQFFQFLNDGNLMVTKVIQLYFCE